MSDADTPEIVIVAGPTASGKSALALAIAEEFAGTIINADSQQVYRDLAVLSARPGDAETARVPHRLYGVIDAAENCSAGRWLALAKTEIDAARAAGRLPILVGGTGLYLEALLNGLAELPPIPASARVEAKALHAALGGAAFRDRLAALDPVGAAKLGANDTQRLTRAYEVALATGKSLSQWQAEQAPTPDLRAAAVVLLPDREGLYEACDARVTAMVAHGAEAEARALLARGLAAHLPAMKAVGLRELGAAREGGVSQDAAIAAMQQATRRYAKRQYTWFRNRLQDSAILRRKTVKEKFSVSLLHDIFSFIRHSLLTSRA
ncbi:MAG TPA: tRNA (adenosine(37)-N6)-dimethylallyltransferase MiaA [Stellaceae bacterium]|jgi:tRNA dimethylallyltransferase|nr:tRNA (adenosine(37)-N6)-dimethylallyltransferase MiaA [Stellaceae bacterium]